MSKFLQTLRVCDFCFCENKISGALADAPKCPMGRCATTPLNIGVSAKTASDYLFDDDRQATLLRWGKERGSIPRNTNNES